MYSYTDGEKRERKEKLDLYYSTDAAADAGSLHFSLGHIVYIFFPSQLLFIPAQHTQMCWQHGVAECMYTIINRPTQHIRRGEDLLHLLLGLLLLPDGHYRLPTDKQSSSSSSWECHQHSIAIGQHSSSTCGNFFYIYIHFGNFLCSCCACLCVNNRTEVSSCRASCFDTRKT